MPEFDQPSQILYVIMNIGGLRQDQVEMQLILRQDHNL